MLLYLRYRPKVLGFIQYWLMNILMCPVLRIVLEGETCVAFFCIRIYSYEEEYDELQNGTLAEVK